MSYVERVLEDVCKRNAEQPEICQAVTEVLNSIGLAVDRNPVYQDVGLLERIVEPERATIFRVPWVDDEGRTRVNRGVGGIVSNLLGAIFGDFSPGTMTGFTPPIYDQYSPYAGFTNPGMGQQNYYMGNHGGYYNNRNIGSGSTVRILD